MFWGLYSRCPCQVLTVTIREKPPAPREGERGHLGVCRRVSVTKPALRRNCVARERVACCSSAGTSLAWGGNTVTSSTSGRAV